jgi:hypothetical protein
LHTQAQLSWHSLAQFGTACHPGRNSRRILPEISSDCRLLSAPCVSLRLLCGPKIELLDTHTRATATRISAATQYILGVDIRSTGVYNIIIMFIWNIGGPLLLLVSAPLDVAVLLFPAQIHHQTAASMELLRSMVRRSSSPGGVKEPLSTTASQLRSICQYEGIVRAASLHNEYSR